jgi:hypothetical protein
VSFEKNELNLFFSNTFCFGLGRASWPNFSSAREAQSREPCSTLQSDTLPTCSESYGHTTLAVYPTSSWWGHVASEHIHFPQIVERLPRIKAKWWLLTPTEEKSWQSLLLDRPSRPIMGTFGPVLGESINTLRHWRVRYSIYSNSLLNLYFLCSYWLKHRSACRYKPPPPLDCLLNTGRVTDHHLFWSTGKITFHLWKINYTHYIYSNGTVN